MVIRIFQPISVISFTSKFLLLLKQMWKYRPVDIHILSKGEILANPPVFLCMKTVQQM